MIKFRIWYKAEPEGGLKQTEVTKDNHLSIRPDGRVHCLNGNIFEQDQFIIEQFTGLLDKNNKEIYIGDIVLCSRYENNEECEVEIKDIRRLPDELFGSNLNWREVIGNIHNK